MAERRHLSVPQSRVLMMLDDCTDHINVQRMTASAALVKEGIPDGLHPTLLDPLAHHEDRCCCSEAERKRRLPAFRCLPRPQHRPDSGDTVKNLQKKRSFIIHGRQLIAALLEARCHAHRVQHQRAHRSASVHAAPSNPCHSPAPHLRSLPHTNPHPSFHAHQE